MGNVPSHENRVDRLEVRSRTFRVAVWLEQVFAIFARFWKSLKKNWIKKKKIRQELYTRFIVSVNRIPTLCMNITKVICRAISPQFCDFYPLIFPKFLIEIQDPQEWYLDVSFLNFQQIWFIIMDEIYWNEILHKISIEFSCWKFILKAFSKELSLNVTLTRKITISNMGTRMML